MFSNLFTPVTPNAKNREDKTPCAYKKMLNCKNATRGVHFSSFVQFSLLADISFILKIKTLDPCHSSVDIQLPDVSALYKIYIQIVLDIVILLQLCKANAFSKGH